MKTDNPITLSGAIIIAGALIAVAVIWTHKPVATTSASADAVDSAKDQAKQVSIAPISAAAPAAHADGFHFRASQKITSATMAMTGAIHFNHSGSAS